MPTRAYALPSLRRWIARTLALLGRTAARAQAVLLITFASAGVAHAATSFEWVTSSSNPTGGPFSGRIVTVDGAGGPGDSLSLADIALFEFSAGTTLGLTFRFSTPDLISFATAVAADGSGLGTIAGGEGFTAINPDDRRMRAVFNAGDVNDNFAVDPTSSAINAVAFSFGGWVLVPEPGPGPLLGLGLLGLAASRRR